MHDPWRIGAVAGTLIALVASGDATVRAQATPVAVASPVLTATTYAPIPTNPAEIWLAPTERPTPAAAALGKAVGLVSDTKYPEALAALQKVTVTGTPLAAYQQYYLALVTFRQGRNDDARQIAGALVQHETPGALAEAARRLTGEIAEAQSDWAAAATVYEPLTKPSALMPDDGWMRLARVRQALGNGRGAAEAYAHVYFEFPLSDLATTASSQIETMQAWEPLESGSARYKLELGRAERLFGAKRYGQARDAFATLAPYGSGDGKEVIALRIAESDYFLKRFQAAHDALEPWTSTARRRAEAQFFYLSTVRESGDIAEYVRLTQALVAAFPGDSWSEEGLNNLATYYILKDDDDNADAVFRQMAQLFPQGRYAGRALWKIGWTQYRTGKWADCATTFEAAAAAFPKSDFRPTWVYWAARSREQLSDGTSAERLYGILVADYLNSYYGRMAIKRLTSRQVEPMTMAAAVAVPSKPDAVSAVGRPAAVVVPGAQLVRALIAAGMYDDALSELQWAQKNGGDSPALQATIGYVWAQKGDLRKGINGIKRAFPQYLSAAGEDLPPDVLKVLFPVAYWDLIRTYAPTRQLDPYLVAALIAQESTFDADIKSHANAIGLMQIVPPTGRSYARRLRIPKYSVGKLTDPQVNMRIGTAYFADLVDRFGGVAYALASYNAGPGPVARWIAERPGVAPDEFIDDIPYPETQNYVRKILGTAEDYRRLYGERGVRPLAGAPGSAVPAVTSAAPPQPAKSAAPAAKKKAPAKKHHHKQ